MMNEQGRSDSPIVPGSSPNKARKGAAEVGEFAVVRFFGKQPRSGWIAWEVHHDGFCFGSDGSLDSFEIRSEVVFFS